MWHLLPCIKECLELWNKFMFWIWIYCQCYFHTNFRFLSTELQICSWRGPSPVAWPSQIIYECIYKVYSNYVVEYCGHDVIIMFDSYDSSLVLTENIERQRHYFEISCPNILFEETMGTTVEQSKILLNLTNESWFINHLAKKLEDEGVTVIQSIMMMKTHKLSKYQYY